MDRNISQGKLKKHKNFGQSTNDGRQINEELYKKSIKIILQVRLTGLGRDKGVRSLPQKIGRH